MICVYLNEVLVPAEVTDEFFSLSDSTSRPFQCFQQLEHSGYGRFLPILSSKEQSFILAVLFALTDTPIKYEKG